MIEFTTSTSPDDTPTCPAHFEELPCTHPIHKITAQHMREVHGWTILASEESDPETLRAMHRVAIDNNGPCPAGVVQP